MTRLKSATKKQLSLFIPPKLKSYSPQKLFKQ
jgi:hypothetical protein